MMSVGSRELKNRLGKYLGLVRQGQAIQITDRGKPIACILPGSEPVDIEGHTVARLLATGTLRLAKGPLRRRARPTRMSAGKSVAQLVHEDRR
jgi:prevent-host-death family protein